MVSWLAPDAALLEPGCPLPLDLPFTAAQAEASGVSRSQLRTLLRRGLVRHVVRGVYAAAQAPGDLTFRARALHLVVPQDAVVTDRTAAWLHGVDVLPRNARTVAVPVSMHQSPGLRVRRPGVDSGERRLAADDVVEVLGLRVTSPVRTACDLGRQLWRFDALAALDQFLRLGVDRDELEAAVGRFRRYRGVIQLRSLVPLADPRAESPAESALRLHWYDAGLPDPTPQWWVCDEVGDPVYRLDLALPVLRHAAEYDGVDHHTSDDDRAHDKQRRAWLRARGWTIEVFRYHDVYGRDATARSTLRRGWLATRRAAEAGTTYPLS